METVMRNVNWNRVLLGGLLAGVIINVFQFVTNGVVLASQWEAAMKALGRSMSGSALIAFTILGFASGITAVLLYATFRPRFGHHSWLRRSHSRLRRWSMAIQGIGLLLSQTSVCLRGTARTIQTWGSQWNSRTGIPWAAKKLEEQP